VASLPFPFPILDPATFFDKGIWGNAVIQERLLVLSDFRADFFNTNLSLKICLF
jgi:hypothetical protein